MEHADMHWICRFGSWFGFTEPARFVDHPDGGYFANADGALIHAAAYNGYRDPRRLA